MNWVAELLIQQKGEKIEVMKIGNIISLGKKWRGNIICLDQMLYADAKKNLGWIR